MEILLVGFTVPLFTAIWGLSGSYAGWIAASALGGSLLGSLVLGPAADRVGRRRIFQAAILWYAVFTALTAFAWGPGSLSAFRFLAGIGLGGMLVVDPAMLAEYLPPQKRGRFLVVLDLFWPVGLLLATGLSWFFLEQVGGDWAWRWLFLAASFPAFLAFVARVSLPESPYFLARKGRRAEAGAVLEQITGTPVDAQALVSQPEPRSSMVELVAPRLRARTAIILLVWIALNISYYGLFLWLPFVLQGEARFTIDVYLLLALSALSQFPGYAAAIWLVERIGRKPTLALFCFSAACRCSPSPSPSPRSSTSPRSSSSGSSTWEPGEPCTPTRPSSSRPGCEAPRSAWPREGGGGNRRPLPLRSADRRHRRDDLVADVRRPRHGRGRLCDPPRTGDAGTGAHVVPWP